MPDLDVLTIVLLVLAGLTAGWVDAVVGGGGLIQLPALLLVPGISPVQALATNKLASIMGTSTSAITYYRRVGPDLTTAGPMALAALVGAFGGAALAAQIPADLFTPIILVVLVVVATYTVAKPKLGEHTNLRWEGNRHRGTAAAIGLVIGAYDGLLGPGTGTFLVIALVSVLGYAFLPASALAKIVNFATNVGCAAVLRAARRRHLGAGPGDGGGEPRGRVRRGADGRGEGQRLRARRLRRRRGGADRQARVRRRARLGRVSPGPPPGSIPGESD